MSKKANPPSPDVPKPLDAETLQWLKDKKRAAKIRRAKSAAMGEVEGELNLTAMMDMLTIILVFLIKSYNTSPAANLTPGLSPPQSSTTLTLTEAITVAITRNDVTVDDKKVIDLNNGRVDPRNFNVPGQPLLIGPVRDALSARVEHHKAIANMGGSEFTGNLLVVADKTLDYELLSQILYTAGQAQLANYKFVTIGQ